MQLLGQECRPCRCFLTCHRCRLCPSALECTTVNGKDATGNETVRSQLQYMACKASPCIQECLGRSWMDVTGFTCIWECRLHFSRLSLVTSFRRLLPQDFVPCRNAGQHWMVSGSLGVAALSILPPCSSIHAGLFSRVLRCFATSLADFSSKYTCQQVANFKS